MRADLGHPAVVQDDYPVRRSRRLQPVGDEDGGAVAGHLVHGGGHPGLGGQVEVGGGLVEKKDGRVDQFGPGQRHQLALAGRERPPSLGQLVEVTAREPGNEIVGADGPGRRLDFGVGCASGRP